MKGTLQERVPQRFSTAPFPPLKMKSEYIIKRKTTFCRKPSAHWKTEQLFSFIPVAVLNHSSHCSKSHLNYQIYMPFGSKLDADLKRGWRWRCYPLIRNHCCSSGCSVRCLPSLELARVLDRSWHFHRWKNMILHQLLVVSYSVNYRLWSHLSLLLE